MVAFYFNYSLNLRRVAIRLVIFVISVLFVSSLSFAGPVSNTLPEQIDPQGKYVFYSHGYIVEGDNPKPVDQKFGWGEYDFPAVKQALSDKDYHLIAYHRPKNTDPFVYANQLNQQIRKLVKHGVSPKHISIVGFSRGAFITGLTSDKVSDLAVNTVILAGCGRLVSSKHTDIKVYGHVLSVYEKSDRANTCKKLKAKSGDVKSFNELEINTNLSHGAFYRPLAEWVNPVKAWIKAKMKSP